MAGFLVSFLVGGACIILGLMMRGGNISSLHSYHRERVAEDDRIPFGKRMGLGIMIIGSGIMVNSILSAVTVFTDNQIFLVIGTAIMFIGLVVGIVINCSAMKKYNKGIF